MHITKKSRLFPFAGKVTVNAEAFSRLDKYYVKNLDDKAVVGPQLQDRMIAAAGITKTYPLQSDHCPFLSIPDKMTEVLLVIIRYNE